MKEQISVPVTLMRGGTSKAVFLAQRDVPSDPQALQRFLLALFGSPDVRQIDGLGGADILTSKCAIIGPRHGLTQTSTTPLCRSGSISLA